MNAQFLSVAFNMALASCSSFVFWCITSLSENWLLWSLILHLSVIVVVVTVVECCCCCSRQHSRLVPKHRPSVHHFSHSECSCQAWYHLHISAVGFCQRGRWQGDGVVYQWNRADSLQWSSLSGCCSWWGATSGGCHLFLAVFCWSVWYESTFLQPKICLCLSKRFALILAVMWNWNFG